MIRSPQALLISLSLHVLMGLAVVFTVVPKIMPHDAAKENRYRIVLSEVMPVLPAAPAAAHKRSVANAEQPSAVPLPHKPASAKPDAVTAVRNQTVTKAVPAVAKSVATDAVEPAVPSPARTEAVGPEKTVRKVQIAATSAVPLQTDAETQQDVSAAASQAAVSRAETPPLPPQTSASYLDAHLDVIARLLRENLFYPITARKRHIEGEVLASFTLRTDGTIRDVTVKKHAQAVLDRAAVQTIESLSGLMPHPQKTLTIEVPIRFVLR